MKTHQELLRNLRVDNDMKQADVANLIGTTQQQYSKYETGESELPLRALKVLADHYMVSVDYIMGRTGCKEGVEALAQNLTAEFTVGEAVSEMLSLSPTNRAAAMEFVLFLNMREASAKKKQTDGRN